MTLECDLKRVSNENRQFFYEMLSYVSPKIQEIVKNENVILIEVKAEDISEVKKKIESLYNMIESGKITGKEVSVKIIQDNSNEDPINTKPIYKDLLRNGDVVEISKGVYAYSNLFLKIFRYFDKKIEEYGKEKFESIIEYQFPVLHPIEKYKKGGYFENFPHYIMFETTLNNDINVLERFSREGMKDDKIFDELKIPIHVLRHAACVPIYEILAGKQINSNCPKSFLVSGKCFRNEGENVFELSRLNEFYMKEYVFVGTSEQCKQLIIQAKGLWDYWQKTLHIKSKIETANDSFFASNYKKLQYFQIIGDSKRELKWAIPTQDNYISCSSINMHRTHFSKPYTIKNEKNEFCCTACFAFGIERLTYAFLSQKGLNPSKWDEQTIEEISKYTDIYTENDIW